jgi:hypothetical protein
MVICDLQDTDIRHPRKVNASVFFSWHRIVRRFKDQPEGMLHVHRELAGPFAAQLVTPRWGKSTDFRQGVSSSQFHQPLADLLGVLLSPFPIRLLLGTAGLLKLR